MKEIQTFRKYLIEEFYDDYREGEISRRTFIRRVAFLTGSMAATIAAMSAVGCAPIELPAANEPMPTNTAAAEAPHRACAAETSARLAPDLPPRPSLSLSSSSRGKYSGNGYSSMEQLLLQR